MLVPCETNFERTTMSDFKTFMHKLTAISNKLVIPMTMTDKKVNHLYGKHYIDFLTR